MKSLFIFFSVMFLTLMFNNTELNAQCPTGYTSRSFTYLYSGTCNITVNYCYMETSPGFFEMVFDGISFSSGCTNAPLIWDSAFWTDVYDKMIEDFPKDKIPDCPQGIVNFMIQKAFCTKYYNDYANAQIKILDCEETGFCRAYYKVCMDRTVQPNVLVKQYVYKFIEVGTDCSTDYIIPNWNSPFWTYSNCYSACVYQ